MIIVLLILVTDIPRYTLHLGMHGCYVFVTGTAHDYYDYNYDYYYYYYCIDYDYADTGYDYYYDYTVVVDVVLHYYCFSIAH